MNYHRNPANGEIVAYDPQTGQIFICEELNSTKKTKTSTLEKPKYEHNEFCNVCKKLGDHLSKDCPSLEEQVGATVRRGVGRPKATEIYFYSKGMLTEEQYNYARELKNLDVSSLDASKEIDMPIKHINWAYQCSHYQDYLRLANTSII
jgi:hypothetical protein